MQQKKHVAIIGAGPGGLSTAKAMLEEGLTVTVFEKSSEIGGVWNLKEGNTWDTLTTHLSKYFETFSDFPWPKTTPILPNAVQVNEYLRLYIKEFNLEPLLKFNVAITYVTQIENSKKWLVRWSDKVCNESFEEQFDGLVLATGAHTDPYIPPYDTINQFKGKLIHSKFYNNLKKSEKLSGKRAIVVGHSVSAAELSADLVNEGAQVLNVFKRPHWIFEPLLKIDPESTAEGISADLIICKRQPMYQQIGMSVEQLNTFQNGLFFKLCTEQVKHPELYIQPNSSEPAFCSWSKNYINHIKDGKIDARRRMIQSFTEDGVILNDGTDEKADIVIFGTGYRICDLSFLDEKIRRVIEYDRDCCDQPIVLYKATIHPDLENFAAIGLLKETSFGIVEIQGRLASRLFSGKYKYPSREEVEKGIEEERQVRTRTGIRSALVHDFLFFPDDIAREIGALPNFDELSKSDPELYKLVWEGPYTNAHYRVNDADKKEIAMKIINEIQDVLKQSSIA